MAIKYLELKPSSVMEAIAEGHGVFCFDRDTRDCFTMNSCTVNAALQLIRRAEASKPTYEYDLRGDYVNRITFWMEVRDDQVKDDD